MRRSKVETTVDELWRVVASGDVGSPVAALEQISYLILLRMLDDSSTSVGSGSLAAELSGAEACRWRYLRNLAPQMLLEVVRDEAFPLLRGLGPPKSVLRESLQGASLSIRNEHVLHRAVGLIDALPLPEDGREPPGEFYEKLLARVDHEGSAGHRQTPEPVIEAMLELADPQPGETVCDPAAGSAALLVAAYQRGARGAAAGHPAVTCYYGWDADPTMLRLGLMNMILHGIWPPLFYPRDAAVVGARPMCDVVLLDPPVGRRLRPERESQRLLRLCLEILRPGGRCAIVLPETALAKANEASLALRRQLLEQNRLEAVVSLPHLWSDSISQRSIVFFSRGGTTESAWFYDASQSDIAGSDSRSLVDLDRTGRAYRILARGVQKSWGARGAAARARARSWTASAEEIARRGYDLTVAAYSPVAPLVQPAEEPAAILARVRELESEITRQLDVIAQRLEGAHDV